MAKGFGVLLVLFGALVCVHQRNEGVFVGEVSTAGVYVKAVKRYVKPVKAYAKVVEPSVEELAGFYVKSVDPYVNAALRYMKPAEAEERVVYVNTADPYAKPAKAYVNGVDEVELSARDRLQAIYMAEVGVRDLSGRNDGERVAEYLRYTDLGEGYAWCASFVSWVYGQAGFAEPRTAWSPALFPAKRVIWRRGDITRSSIPKKGDVFGIYFNSVKRIAHAGFVDEWGDKYVVTVEGNTNEAGSREGDGVYRKLRPVSSIYRVAKWL